jgi:hypothetical protein
LLILCILNSCQKEFEDPNDSPTNTIAEFRAKINGDPFVADLYGATIRADTMITLAGKSADGQQIGFTVGDSGVHVYVLDINSISNVGSYLSPGSLGFTSREGTTPAESGGNLAIVSIDPVKRIMSGTFNFKAFRLVDGAQRIITEGVFNNIPY